MADLRRRALELPIDPADCRAWTEGVAPFPDAAPAQADPAPGTLGLTRHRLGALTLVAMAAPPQTLRRTPAMAAGQGGDGLMVLFCLDGEASVTWPGGAAGFGRLQGVLLDLAQPAALVAGPMRATGLVLPRALVADQVPMLATLHGAVLDPASDPVSRLFFTCVQELAETASALGGDQVPQITRAVATLCGAALRRLAPRSTASDREEPIARTSAASSSAEAGSRPSATGLPGPDEVRRSIAVRRFIQAELGSPNLSVETVAARFGLSRAGLYRLFCGEGGVQRFIREQRLVRAMAMLARPRDAGRPRVSTVADACGFSDEKTFSRAFKRRFGLLPSVIRPALPLWDEADPVPARRPEDIAA